MRERRIPAGGVLSYVSVSYDGKPAVLSPYKETALDSDPSDGLILLNAWTSPTANLRIGKIDAR